MNKVLLVATCLIIAAGLAEASDLAEDALRTPEYVDSQPVMPREDWVHNFKVSSVPGLCTNPDAGFALVYKGAPEDCYMTVRTLIDKCMEGPLDGKIPKMIHGLPMAYAAAQNLGRCVLDAYLASGANKPAR
ncbi:MAG: hypothetical protein QF790_08065 [Gammaproteobacteria bacterium]|nr:hypothetical protein [Gammaproteobacteria bacterium]MDP6617101.1 hypothetical protein [Gammaproteobacteria bacterium]MDP6695789.1 hypothetical protein [Gammaproteobacteria bacterium]